MYGTQGIPQQSTSTSIPSCDVFFLFSAALFAYTWTSQACSPPKCFLLDAHPLCSPSGCLPPQRKMQAVLDWEAEEIERQKSVSTSKAKHAETEEADGVAALAQSLMKRTADLVMKVQVTMGLTRRHSCPAGLCQPHTEIDVFGNKTISLVSLLLREMEGILRTSLKTVQSA
eukprot:1140697-Pelagomonas_calceolata.AAC.2